MLARVSGEMTMGQDPEVRFTPNGMAVASARAVSSSRKQQDDGTWVDDKSSWVTLTAFGPMAENFAESCMKGQKVLVDGRLHVEEWEDKDGNKRITPKVLLDTVGPSLAFATAKVTKVDRRSGGSGGGQQVQRSSSPAQDDPWATGPSTPDDPPF